MHCSKVYDFFDKQEDVAEINLSGMPLAASGMVLFLDTPDRIADSNPDPEIDIPSIPPVSRERVPVVGGAVFAALYVAGVRDVVDIQEKDDAQFADVSGPSYTGIEEVV